MKNLIIIPLFILIFAGRSFSSTGSIQAFFSYATFYSPGQGTYIETYLTIIGKSVIFKRNDNEKLQGSLNITIKFEQNGTINSIKKYNLLSPETNDKTTLPPDFIDQQRIPIENGIYNMEVVIKDNYDNDENHFKHIDIITIDYPPDKVKFSDIQLIENYQKSTADNIFSKNGYDLTPYILRFYSQTLNRIIFYSELYNTNKALQEGEDILLRYYIETANKNEPVQNYSRFKKLKAKDVIVTLSEFQIDNLPSGNYNLVFEVFNRQNELIASKKVFFQRSNPRIDSDINITSLSNVKIENTFVEKITSKDSLMEVIQCIHPIADINEAYFIDNSIGQKDTILLRRFFYNFWSKRNTTDPEKEWNTYAEQVRFVNKWYKTPVRKGYETDRGRVYLQYGTPNNIISSENEPSAYPYEIWQYYQLGNMSNKRFVFYNPELAGNNYSLLHSDVPGETNCKNWERMLNKRNNDMYNHEKLKSDEQWGGRALDNYKNH